MQQAKLIGGILLCVLGAVLGLWAGVWWAFIGGIVDILQQIRAPELNAFSVAIGIGKVVLSGAIGWIVALCFFAPGATLIKRHSLANRKQHFGAPIGEHKVRRK